MTRANGSGPDRFQVELRSPDMELTPALRQYALDHIAAKLEKHAGHVQSVIIRFEVVTGPNHAATKACRIEVLLARHAPLVVEEINQDLRAAMDLAADRVERAVQREVQRRRDLPRDAGRRIV